MIPLLIFRFGLLAQKVYSLGNRNQQLFHRLSQDQQESPPIYIYINNKNLRKFRDYIKILKERLMQTRKNLDQIIENLKKGQRIQQNQVKYVCELAKDILKQQSNVVRVKTPVTICGDIHGQFDDLLQLFKIGGFPPYANYLFLGDYVDRGKDSVQTFLLLLVLKVRYKSRITLLRGNHQSRLITQVYGFYDQCIRKYGSLNVWRAFTDIFDYLSIAAVVDNKVFCIHGGLSPKVKLIQDINSFDRIKQIPQQGTICQLLWSDPEQIEGWASSQRGAGYLFGKQPVQIFCRNNGIQLIARAHQLVMQGYKYMFNQKLVTVWSAPNYYYRCGNVASILELDQSLQRFFKIFEEAPADGKIVPGSQVPHYFL